MESRVKCSPSLPSRIRIFVVAMEIVIVFVRPMRVHQFLCLRSGGDGERHVAAERFGQHLHGVAGALVAHGLPAQQLNEDVHSGEVRVGNYQPGRDAGRKIQQGDEVAGGEEDVTVDEDRETFLRGDSDIPGGVLGEHGGVQATISRVG